MVLKIKHVIVVLMEKLDIFSKDEDIPEGWVIGNSIIKGVKKEYGLRWYSNLDDKISKRLKDCPDGWVEGRKFKTSGFDNINNNPIIKYINIDTLEIVKVDKSKGNINDKLKVLKFKKSYYELYKL